ncbi:MAG: DUF2059 domain-containing protein [Magnetospirillum sp.]|nr:DUF2059 domain-containing protein [Magnetospirillum sp.]
MRRLAPLFAIVLGLAALQPAWADSRVDKARDLMKTSGAEALILRMIDQSLASMMPLLRKSLPEAPPGFFGLAEEEMAAGFRNATSDIISVGVAEYAQAFSEDELDQLLAFYNTPTGRKVITAQPQLMERVAKQSQVLGQRVGEDAMKRAIKRFEAGERKP